VPATGTASAVWLLDTPAELTEGDALLIAIDGANTQPIQVSVTPFGGYDPLTVGDLPRTPADQAVAYLCSVQPARPDFEQVKAMAAKLRDYRRGEAWSLVTEARAPITVRILHAATSSTPLAP
jgi:hypothetical protein